MQVKLFNIPISDAGVLMGELNAFLRSHKVLDMEQKLIHTDHGGSWCFCVGYIDGPLPSPVPANASQYSTNKKVDYKEVLPADVFAIFSSLRECRKQLAKEYGKALLALYDAIPAEPVLQEESR